MIQSQKRFRVNEAIDAATVRLIDSEGKQRGIIALSESLNLAQKAGLDLVEIVADANPPVCKILDFGKYQYEQKKRKQEAKKKQKHITIKEVKFRPSTDVGDYNIKLKRVEKFITEGHKVKVSVWFRGREIMYQDLGVELIERISEDVASFAQIESDAQLEGRQMIMILTALKKVLK